MGASPDDAPLSNARGPEIDGGNLRVSNYGVMTPAAMLDLLVPGAIDHASIVGRRVRWTYRTTRSGNKEARRISEELKQLHLQLGAAEVLIHHAPWAPEER